MNKIIEKYKNKFPVGSVIKHKHCNTCYKIIGYEYRRGFVNFAGVLTEEFVHLEILNYPKDQIGKVRVYDIEILKQFIIYN